MKQKDVIRLLCELMKKEKKEFYINPVKRDQIYKNVRMNKRK